MHVCVNMFILNVNTVYLLRTILDKIGACILNVIMYAYKCMCLYYE